jgi:hypothetical protein
MPTGSGRSWTLTGRTGSLQDASLPFLFPIPPQLFAFKRSAHREFVL